MFTAWRDGDFKILLDIAWFFSPPKVSGKGRKCNEAWCRENPSDMELFVHGAKEERGGQQVTAKQAQVLKKPPGKTWRINKRCTFVMELLSAFPQTFMLYIYLQKALQFNIFYCGNSNLLVKF